MAVCSFLLFFCKFLSFSSLFCSRNQNSMKLLKIHKNKIKLSKVWPKNKYFHFNWQIFSPPNFELRQILETFCWNLSISIFSALNFLRFRIPVVFKFIPAVIYRLLRIVTYDSSISPWVITKIPWKRHIFIKCCQI